MKFQSVSLIVLASSLACFAPASIGVASANTPREIVDADGGWKFTLGDPAGAELLHLRMRPGARSICRTTGALRANRKRTIPAARVKGSFRRNWMVSQDVPRSCGLEGKRVAIEFDGVYRDATVYLNGHKLGMHPYGYTAFEFDLTTALDYAGANVLAVRVDNSAQPNSRWYSGSGIYRHVRVVVTDPTHVAHWGVFVTTPEATSSAAKVSLRTRVANDDLQLSNVLVETRLLDKTGKNIGETKSNLSIAPGKDEEAAQEITVRIPPCGRRSRHTLQRDFDSEQKRKDC